ncbi:MAG TPA: hypothetical protein VFW29_04205 [Solirubrobacteraceae bacterium]|nr:hypothetical protein [Solirubrobacteraceae bacterium]
MFLATVLLYPLALGALCMGAGLLVDRAAGGSMSAALLPAVGAGALIGVSQLSTFVVPLAPATPYILLGVALAGFGLGHARAASVCAAAIRRPWLAGGPALVYLLAIAPVLLAGRTSFSSFMALSDSAVHLIGADYLIHHGQSYAHLDLRSSYGRFINAYYNTSYPSGADTLFGGSAALLGLPLIWAFQPFGAFLLACGFGPAWLIARRAGLAGARAWTAAVCAVVPALVYAYDLIGSVKEVGALTMALAAGALVISHRRWLGRSGRGALPVALVLAAGVSTLGAAFGVWALVALAVLAGVLAGRVRAGTTTAAGALAVVALGAVVGALATLPTLADLGGSLRVAGSIASTTNSGNLQAPLRAIQVFGVWLNGSYKLAPHGGDLVLTHVLIAVAGAAAVAGGVALLRARAFALLAWIALTLLAWLVLSQSVATWANAKTLVITSPVVVLLGWTGIGALARAGHGGSRAHRRRSRVRASSMQARRARARVVRVPALAAAGVGAALVLGTLVSDEMQYRASNLAPTARYQELAAVGHRFAGEGPAVFTDFDEYALYELRNLRVGGPDFVYPPPALAAAAGGYGDPVDLERVAPAALSSYPLIVTRRTPLAPRPPAAYLLAWQGAYYQVWRRSSPAALVHRALAGAPATQCAQLGALAAHASAGARLVAAVAPTAVRVAIRHARHPRRWGREREGLVMGVPGTLSARFEVGLGGAWNVWIQGQFMPTVKLAVDGHPLRAFGGELSGNSLVPGTVPPRTIELAAGAHVVTVTRGPVTFAPGARGSAVLDAILLTPAAAPAAGVLASAPAARWRTLCGRSYAWAELERGGVSRRA